MYTATINNLATVTGSNSDYDEAFASTTYTCYAPVVEKDADGSYDEFHTWDIDKLVDPTSQWGFAGDQLDWTWTVDLSEVLSEDNFAVTGDITVFNAAPGTMTVSLVDVLNDAAATPGVISGCIDGVFAAGSLEIPAGGTATCDYDAAPLDRTATLNTATATLNTIDFDATAPVLFEVTVYDGSADVADDQEADFPLTVNAGDGPWHWIEAYSHTCSSVFADYGTDGMYTATINNLATVTGSNSDYDEAFASTTYTCYAPVVEKDADTEWFRDYTWDITKDWDGTYSLLAGESVVHDYRVTVNQYIDDYGYRAFGAISVFNAAPGTMTVLLSDVLSDATPVTISGCSGTGVSFVDPTLMIPAGGTATCDYSVGLLDDTGLTNTATATLNGIPFASSAPVDFGDPIVSGYASVNVDDTNGPSWFTAGSNVWDYTKTFTCPSEQSAYTDGVFTIIHPNTATIFETGQWDDALVTVVCEFPWEGLTPGFWQGGDGAYLWDEVDDTDFNPMTGNPFTHDTLFNSFFTPHSVLNELTMMDIVGTGGGPNVERQTARMVVAAYLNASHAGVTYQYSTAEIHAMWTGAVDGTGLTFAQVRDLLGAANELGAVM
jgi:hypothetical protein